MTHGVTVMMPAGPDGTRPGPVLIDKLTRAMVSIGVSQCQVHIGLMYTVDTFDEGVTGGNPVEWLVRVAATNDAYLDFIIAATGDALLEVFEGPTVTADGSTLTPLNRKRRSTDTPGTLFFKGPTTTADGTRVDRMFVPGGSGGSSQGRSLQSPVSLVLTEGDYLVRFTNRAAGAVDMCLVATLYEGLTVES